MKSSSMYIHLNGLKLFAFHGVMPQESKTGAEYTIDIRLKTDFSTAAETDRLEGTVNYAEVYRRIKEEMEIPSHLLEHVSFRIARRLMNDFPTLTEIRICLYKQNPPMGADCRQVGTEVTYTR